MSHRLSSCEIGFLIPSRHSTSVSNGSSPGNREQAGSVNPEWIYQHIFKDKATGGELHRHLRCRKRRRKRYGAYDRRGQLVNRVSIDDRPAIVTARSRLGDWEVYTIIGCGYQQALVSLTERRSRLTLLQKVTRKTADEVSDAVRTLCMANS